MKVRDFFCKSRNSVVPIDAYLHRLANEFWTRAKSWIMSSFKYHTPNDFFLSFICFHVLHAVRHRIYTIFMLLKTVSCAGLISGPLCWSIYWWIMWFRCGFEFIAKNHHRVYIATVTGICVGNQGNVREKSGIFFLPNPWQPWILGDLGSRSPSYRNGTELKLSPR